MDFTKLITDCINKAGKQETLATILDLAPSSLSQRISGDTGWREKEINKMLEFLQYDIIDLTESSEKITTLKKTIKILSEGI